MLTYCSGMSLEPVWHEFHEWAHYFVATSSSDRWLNIMTGLGAAGAVVAGVGVVVGGIFAWRYGRKASVSISATPHEVPDGVILATRPVVKGVGLFRVKFHGPKGASVQVREVRLDDSATSGLRLDRQWEQEAVFGEQHADGGEELPTTVMFRLQEPDPAVVGWVVWVSIQAPTRWMPGSSESWADRIFVPRPKGGK
jgi:hypothetical protein